MINELPCKKSEVCWLVWRDAVGGGSRVHRDEIGACGVVINKNIGWIVHEDKSRVALAQGSSQTGELDVTFIPIENVIERIYPYKRKK